MKKRTAALLCSSILLAGIAVRGTMAWLTANTAPVLNTFTVGDVIITLQEHEYDLESKKLTDTIVTSGETNNYKFVPGDTLPKDPFVTVDQNSEDCWLFIHVEEEYNTNDDMPKIKDDEGKILGTEKIIQYSVDSNYWLPVVDADGNTIEDFFYYCRKVDGNTTDTTASAGETFHILTGDQVTVNENVLRGMVSTNSDASDLPKLIFTAAAIQYQHVDSLADAWAHLPDNFKGE